jgi:branched-chain amino acid transport system substrate-binding protein
MITELSHELSDPTVDAQIVDFKGAGADVLIQFTQSKFAAQGIRVAAELDWHPMHILASNAGSIGTTFIPAGAEVSKGVITTTWERNPADPTQSEHPAVKDFKAFAARYMPSLDLDNAAASPGYNNAYMIEQVLERCGDDLSRENLLNQATTLKDVAPPMLIDGIGVYNSPTNYRALHNLQLTKFDGKPLMPIGKPSAKR